jgi:hypothetical protein
MRAIGRGSGRYVAMTARVSYRWVNFRTISARRFDILLRPVNVSRIAAPQSLPAHQYTQSNLTMDRVTAAQYRAIGPPLTSIQAPVATTLVRPPLMTADSGGFASSRGRSGSMTMAYTPRIAIQV